MDFRDELLEELAALEHRQWMEWSQSIAESEDISEARLERWNDYWVPYEDLPDDVQEYDREWARNVIDVLTDV